MTPDTRDHTTTAKHLALLTALALPLYFIAPDAAGVLNWQEATRALVAREMQRNAEWIVPTIFGDTYLNKPPLFYWLTIAVAEARQQTVTLADARTAAAIGAWLAVITTYLAAKPLYRRLTDHPEDAPRFALLAALFLATATLLVRSARMAEIDILTVAPVTAAVACSLLAWHNARTRGPTAQRLALIAGACAAAALTALAKGPPPAAALLLGSAAAPAIVAARRSSSGPAQGTPKTAAAALTAALFLTLGLLAPPDDFSLPGLAILAGLGALIGAWLADLARPNAARAWWPPLRRTHPWIVAAAAAAALSLWLNAASNAIGASAVAQTVDQQAQHNLVLFAPNASTRNLGYLAYAAGAASPLALAALLWIAKDRPRLPFLTAALAVWLVLGFTLFSVFGKGIARYMTPLWPAAAMLAAAALLHLARKHPNIAPHLNRAAIAAVAVLFLAQTWWYAHGRTINQPPSAPRHLADRIRSLDIDPARLVFINDDLRELEFIFDHRIPTFDIEDEPDAVQRLRDHLADTATADPAIAVTVDDNARRDLQRFTNATGWTATPRNGLPEPLLHALRPPNP